MDTLPDNVVWQCLSGEHARFSVGDGEARRYLRGFSPIAGFADSVHPNLDALASVCEPGEHLYIGGWSGEAPPSWRIDMDGTMFMMVWEEGLPDNDDSLDMVRLNNEHTSQVLDLVALTEPGPFGSRTIELGEYFGVFSEGRLIAMAGERFHAGNFHEISGVCTDPRHQGNGLARRLTLNLIRRQMQRGETPFLTVVATNTRAARLYEHMGFGTCIHLALRQISRR